MEEVGKAHGAISGDVAEALSQSAARLHPVGYEKIKGISTEIPIFEYRVDGEAALAAIEGSRGAARARAEA
jgi:hypothetical protein